MYNHEILGEALDREPISAHYAWHDEELWCGESTGCHHTRFLKAFDTVPNHRLLGKLEHYGVKGSLLAWVESFLIGRTQSVLVDGVWSKEEAGGSGVRCPPRYRPRTTPLYPLHKWPPSLGALSNMLPPFCGWLLVVPCYPFCSGPNLTPRWP